MKRSAQDQARLEGLDVGNAIAYQPVRGVLGEDVRDAVLFGHRPDQRVPDRELEALGGIAGGEDDGLGDRVYRASRGEALDLLSSLSCRDSVRQPLRRDPVELSQALDAEDGTSLSYQLAVVVSRSDLLRSLRWVHQVDQNVRIQE